MEVQSIQEYERLEKYYWWFVGRRRIIERTLERFFGGRTLHILDWGCGPGGNFKSLQKYGTVLGVDESDEAISACAKKGITGVVKAATLSEFQADTKFDLITCFDVLEHISEDQRFLTDIRSLLLPGGSILVTVPAYQFLWTGFDEVLGHRRRYTLGDICKKFNASGYRISYASYFIFFLSPAFIAYRIFQKIRRVRTKSLSGAVIIFPGVINWLFTKILFLEALLVPYVRLPFGTSIIVVATKHG